MERIEYHTVENKVEWGQGPWVDEPDKIQWPDQATGLPCLIVRNHGGALCGYVGIQEGHPLFGKRYDHEDCYNLEAHGGLTFSDKCFGAEEDRSICHIPGAGEPDHVWWLGFDCAHCMDHAPAFEARYRVRHGESPTHPETKVVYRDVAYVTDQCQKLAEQLARIQS